MTAAEIAAREQIPVQKGGNTWLERVSTKTGESPYKAEGNIIHDSQGLRCATS